ncbi:MAG: C40 family peptidase [Bacteroidales bacterium]|nr:C40 family peptidase [Bacteroidales bacterium]
MKRTGILLLTALAVASCGLTRRTPSYQEPDAPVILPLTDSADIARSRERAQVVMDSIARVQSGARSTSSGGSIASRTEKQKTPAVRKELVDNLLDYAKTFIGVPYRLGASGPTQFDCSGFTSYVYREFGYELPHNSQQQYKDSRPVESFSDLRKGDLVFFGARGSIRNIGHVGIVVDVDLDHGSFRFIHASTSNGVEIQRSTQPYFMMRYMGAGRILPD